MTQTYSGGCQCGRVRYEVQMGSARSSRVTALDVAGWVRCIGTHPKTGDKLAAINVRCLDGVDVDLLKIKKVDGRSL